MDDELKAAIKKYALQNAVRFKGKANQGAVIGKLIAENAELKGKLKDLSQEITKTIREINQLGLEKQLAALKEIAPELLKKREVKDKDIFDFIEIKDGEKVVTAFPPEPSKYPHIGHAKAIILNYELAKRHNGKFILRFEDTNPELAEAEFYEINLENYKWLGVNPDIVDYASDHMGEIYKYAEKIIEEGNAYMCTCRQEKMKMERREGIECDCRISQRDKNMELWKKMFDKKGGMRALRLKGCMQSNNSALRDPVLFRVNEQNHPRHKKKYRVWPTYDFENAIMDGIEGVTHRLRSKEFELRSELQGLVQKMAGLAQTKLYEFSRFNLEGVESSGRIIRGKVHSKELIGWDDPSLTTIVALRRRGFLAKAIKEFVLSTGITKSESVLTWDDLVVHNRRMLDSDCNRYFFLHNPKEIKIENAPNQEVELKLHPEFSERGSRKFKTNANFYIESNDYKTFKDGKIIRLMDCINFKKLENRFVFDSLDYENYKKHGEKIIHWLPVSKDLVTTEILMPDKRIIKGISESSAREIKENDIVQFARFGFCRLDKIEKNKLIFWFTHS
jgi:glutamyl-tRNA synthetase